MRKITKDPLHHQLWQHAIFDTCPSSRRHLGVERLAPAAMQVPCYIYLFQDERLAQAGRCLDVAVDPLRHEVCT